MTEIRVTKMLQVLSSHSGCWSNGLFCTCLFWCFGETQSLHTELVQLRAAVMGRRKVRIHMTHSLLPVTQISDWIRTHKGQHTAKKWPYHLTRTVSRRPLTTEDSFKSLEQVFFPVIRLSPVSISPSMPNTYSFKPIPQTLHGI
jgi:hypothetical protein